MNLPSTIFNRFLKRKIATALLVSASVCAFATLGDDGGKKNGNKDNSSVLLPYSSKNFSLRSNYNYKGNNFIVTEKKNFIVLNRVVTFQKGNAAYVLPLKKMPLMGKIKFTFAQ